MAAYDRRNRSPVSESLEDLESPFLDQELFVVRGEEGWEIHMKALEAESPFLYALEPGYVSQVTPKGSDEELIEEENATAGDFISEEDSSVSAFDWRGTGASEWAELEETDSLNEEAYFATKADDYSGDGAYRDASSPNEEAYFEHDTSAKVAAAQPTLALDIAVTPFSPALRSRLFPLLSPAGNKTALAWSLARYPAKFGVEPQLVLDRLRDYVDLTAVENAIKQFNAAYPSTPIVVGAGVVNSVFVEAVHQFQLKCFAGPNQDDGKAGAKVLHSLGIIEPKGRNALARVNPHAQARLEETGIRGQIGSTVIDHRNWFDFIVNPSIFGWTTDIDPGVHYELAKRLRTAENSLLAMPAYKNLTPAELGKRLGIGEVHKGYRYKNAGGSYHIFGLAIDISYDANPWIRGTTILAIIRNASLLHGRAVTDMTGARHAQQYLSSLSSKYSTDQIYDIFRQHHEDFVKYLSYANDLAKITALLASSTASASLVDKGESVDAAAARWQREIRKHWNAMQGADGDITFKRNNGTCRDFRKGFFSHNKDLVITLRDKVCLAWGAVDLGPGADASGDIMHFDMRSIPPFSKHNDTAVSHPCRTGNKAQSLSGEWEEQPEHSELFQRDTPRHKPLRVGWRDAAPGGTSDITIPPEPAGWNQGKWIVGGMVRIPLEGLMLGYQLPDEQRRWTHEAAKGKAIVVIPKGLDGMQLQELLLYFHGDGPGHRQAGTDFCIFPDQGCLKRGVVEDIETARITQQLQESKRPIMAVLPQCPTGARPGWPTNCDRYLAEIFDRLKQAGIWKTAPSSPRVVLAGHSRGGDTLFSIVTAQKLLPDNRVQLILFDGIHGSGWQKHVLSSLTAELRELEKMTSLDDQKAYLSARLRFRAYHARPSYAKRHRNLNDTIEAFFRKNKPRIPAEILHALRCNYQVIEAGHHDHFLVGRPLDGVAGKPPLLHALDALVDSLGACANLPSTPRANELVSTESLRADIPWGDAFEQRLTDGPETEEAESLNEEFVFEAHVSSDSEEPGEWNRHGAAPETEEWIDDPKCRTGKAYPTTVSFVPEVANIMQAKGWEVGARLQRRWLSGRANRLVGEASRGTGTNGPLAIEKVSMDWALAFDRARRMFSIIQQYDVVVSPKARKLLEQRLDPLLPKLRAGSDFISFGNYPEGLAREEQYINHVSMDAYDAFGAVVSKGLDDLSAALGRFSMFVIPKGKAFLRDNKVAVSIEELGIYIRDSFDFEGDQELGRWKLPDRVEPVLEDPGVDRMKSACSDNWFYMANWIFREYRNASGQYGEDFLVYSDIKRVRLEPYYGYEYPMPAGGSSTVSVPASHASPASSTSLVWSASSYKGRTLVIESADARLRNEDLSGKKYGAYDTLPGGKKIGDYVTLPKGKQVKIASVKTDRADKVFVLVYDAVSGNAASPLGWTSSENFKGKLHNETLDLEPATYIVPPSVRTDFFTVGNHAAMIRKGGPGYQPDKSLGKLPQGEFVAVVDESKDTVPAGKYVKIKSLKRQNDTFVPAKDLGWTAKSNLVPGLADFQGPNAAWESSGSGVSGDYLKQIDLYAIVARDGKKEKISRDVYPAFVQLVQAAAGDGIEIVLEDGFRSYPDQVYLYKLSKQGKGNRAAPPGQSNHQNGIAFDLVVQHTSSKGVGTGAVYSWLKKNATTYGFVRTVPSEAWHWEYRPSLAVQLKGQGQYRSWDAVKREIEEFSETFYVGNPDWELDLADEHEIGFENEEFEDDTETSVKDFEDADPEYS